MCQYSHLLIAIEQVVVFSPKMTKYSANFSLLTHQFPLSFPLEQPLDGGLRRARLTLQEGAAALHPKLHRFSQTLLYCTERDKRNGDNCKTKPFNFKCAKHKKSPDLWR